MERKSIIIDIPDGMCIDESKSTFEKIVFKRIDNKPRSWEEYCEQQRNNIHFVSGYDILGGYASRRGIYENGYCTLPSEELAKAFLAMMQLMSLRHDWIHKWSIDNGTMRDWIPDWNDDIEKWCIIFQKYKVIVDYF